MTKTSLSTVDQLAAPILATKTKLAIEEAIEKDQGASFRGHLRHLMPLAEDAYREDEESFRSHLGASIIGKKCAREIWYSFRWCTKPRFSSRIVRLFNRGHLEEPRFVAMLLAIQCKVWCVDENGKQFRISGYKGHYGGGMDAVVLGIPEVPNEPVLGEFKTHNEKSFAKLEAEGVRKSKPTHWVQMQQYMGKNGFNWALYMAVNKNNDDLYCELVPFCPTSCSQQEARAVMIIDSDKPPARISKTPGWFECKFCDYRSICHLNHPPEQNCRTCVWALPADEGIWTCRNPQCSEIVLTKDRQLEGCSQYSVIREIGMK